MPTAPRASFIAWASACTAGGCDSPAITRALAPARFRSFTIGAAQACATPPSAGTPRPAATARAKPSISELRSGRRWSAEAPVDVGEPSTTYSRFISGVSPLTLRRAANSRTRRRLAGCEATKSASRLRITSAWSKRYCASTGSPKARTAPARVLSRPAGSQLTHFACGKAARTPAICAANVGEVTRPVRKRRPAPPSAFCLSSASRSAARKSPQVRSSPT